MVGCKLKRIMDLEFDFDHGACGTYNVQNEEKVMLCFEGLDMRCDWLVYQ